MVLKPLGCNPEGNDSLISFFFMFCWSVNTWGCFHHNWKIFIFMSYFWAKIWSITFGHIWEVLDCLISFLCFFIEWVNPWWCFLNFFISREFLAPHTKKVVWNLPGAPQKVQFLSTFLIHVKSLQAKLSWSIALILFDFSENLI